MKTYRVGPKVPPYKLHKRGLGPWGPDHFTPQKARHCSQMRIPSTECIQTAHFVQGFRRKRAWIPSKLCMNSAQLNIDKLSVVWYHNNALAVTEDRATQECDLSAGYGVSGKSDAMDGVALLFLLYACYHSSRKP